MNMRTSSIARVLLILASGVLLFSLLSSCSTVPVHDSRQADALAAAGDDAGALQEYSRAINLDPGQAQAYLGRGYVYEKTGNYEKALEDYSAYLRLQPQNPQGYLIRGMLLEILGRNSLALTDYDSAIGLAPSNASAYYTRGSLFEKQGNSRAAIADYTTAARLGQKDAQNKLNSMGVVW
jgi:tetratricopeptide (TPR) repeat protein